MEQFDNNPDITSSREAAPLNEDKRQGKNRPKISILAIVAFVGSILVAGLLGIVFHMIRTGDGLDRVPLQHRKLYELFYDFCVFKFAPGVVVLSIVAVLRVLLSRGKTAGLRLAIVAVIISVAAYLLFWLAMIPNIMPV